MKERMQYVAALSRRRTPLVLQTEAAECGLACLAMIAGRYGYRTDLAALRQRFSLSMRGTSLRDLVQIASQMKLASRALRAEPAHLRRVRLPCLLHWDHNHFVVLSRIGSRCASILDPAVGHRRVSLAELDKRFTGIVLEAWPTDGFERKAERARSQHLGIAAAGRRIFLGRDARPDDVARAGVGRAYDPDRFPACRGRSGGLQ